jgi:predicted MFS family arabinose efflux permease
MALALAVAVVLADSSVVILALPAILNEFHVEIPTVAWVLTSFNLVLAICAVPVAYLARRRPRLVLIAGAIIFAMASAVCGLADGFTELMVARCVQAVAGLESSPPHST